MKIFSGIQPTGKMHIGNYLGAIKQWVEFQQTDDCMFCVVDLHALTIPQNPNALRKAVAEKVIELLSVGVDPAKSILFVQSHVKEHTELAWMLSTLTSMGELERMTQYKEKARKNKANQNAGLLTYPVLMAADILLYQTEGVPVGKDQGQHLEITRDIAKRFNARFGKTFVEPKTLFPKAGAKVLSLKDPKKKMSKSDDPESYIALFDEPEAIRKKIMSAVTDTGKEIRYNPERKPGISNLLLIYSLMNGKSIAELERQFKTKGYAALKKSLAEILIETLEPFRRKQKELQSRELYIQEILKQGAKKASSLAEITMKEVRKRMGLLGNE